MEFLVEFLEHFLHVLKQFACWVAIAQIIPVRVRRFQDTAIVDNILTRTRHKLGFAHATAAALVELVAVGLNSLLHFGREFACLVVIVPTLEVVHVAPQLVLGIVLFLFHFAQTGIVLLSPVVFVAFVVTPGRCSMLLPVSHAEPAELVATAARLLAAGHAV